MIAFSLRPRWAPGIVLGGLLTAFLPLTIAWRRTWGTALRGAVVWSFLGIALAAIGQVHALTVPLETGRPWTGHATYLSSLTMMAAMISVFNARRPGSGAWAILMGMLVLVFLIPWLEGSGLVRPGQALGRLRLETPWTIFYVLIVLAGVTNYLPTRYGLASAVLGISLGLEYLGLTRQGWSVERRAWIWSVVPWGFVAAAWLAGMSLWKSGESTSRLERLWLWFRDHWGVVWTLRVQERFNRAAVSAKWPIRLEWQGLARVTTEQQDVVEKIPDAALATLKSLLLRFADSGRLDAVADGGRTCDSPNVGGS